VAYWLHNHLSSIVLNFVQLDFQSDIVVYMM